jgi:hypothetical protein
MTAPGRPGGYPIPAGRGRWRLTLHRRTFTVPGETWTQTIIAELGAARGRQLDQTWDAAAQLTFTVDGHDPAAATVAELQHDVCAWRWDDRTGADVCVFRGVVDHSEDQITEQSHTVTFVAHDYLAMIGRRFLLDSTQVIFTAVDADALAATFVARANGAALGFTPGSNLPVGVVIVDASGATRARSGVLRDRTYTGGTNLGTALDDLAKVIGGFDYDIIPEAQAADTLTAVDPTGALHQLGPGLDAVRIFYPAQGVTRNDLALVYGSTVSTVTRTVASADYANYIRVFGNNASADPTAAQLISTASNSDASAAAVGYWPNADNAADVVLAATLDQQAAGDLALSGILMPTYTLGLRPGAYSWGYPRMGDSVPLIIASGRLNVNSAARVLGISYAISDDGGEDVTLTVGRPLQTLAKLFTGSRKDVNALARR